ncbi:caspase family protein [Variovorax sp. PBL-E5]|uniref:caspase family protein n=1 Tax=Variovorax sp. PBL-E5 TaxID=434014 RepID=UPI001316BAAF|nr:caspase family protein [Variovorax sp. PBL-E5]VTU35889.1 putative protein containing caspase domain protein [Variovorax sp. PBL-E5]
MEHRAARVFRFASFLFALCLLTAVTGAIDAARAQSRPAEKRIALVIGNSRYPKIPLGNPENDARLIAANLRKLGFEVNEQLNLDIREFRRVLREFARRLQDDDAIAVFYYAGHGMQIDGRNYLLPVDIQLRDQEAVKDDAVDIEDVFLSRLDKTRSKARIVILDTCRDNPFAGRTRSVRSAVGLAEMGARGTLIAYAAAPGSSAEDGPDGGNSVYSKNLAQEMMVPGLEVEQMFKNVRVKVLHDTKDRQVPWVNTSLTSDFSFNPGAETLSGEAARQAQIQRLELELQQTRKALEESRAAARAPATATATATASTSPTSPAAGPSKAPAAAPAAAPRPAAAAEVVKANERYASQLEIQLERARVALAEARAESRGEATTSLPQGLPAALEAAEKRPTALAPTPAPDRSRGCRDLLTRASIGEPLSTSENNYLKQECK